TKYKLTYFDLRGLGEGARLIFHQAGVQFEDHRITQEEWPNLKPKYLGRQFGLVPKDPIEEAVDAIYDADIVIPASDRRTGSGFLVGKSLTWADLAIFDRNYLAERPK
uniref:glutathione transferase (Fragments) n=1 Tax=Ascaridia galli TaxID=46685 RepID=Q7M4I7_9BILA